MGKESLRCEAHTCSYVRISRSYSPYDDCGNHSSCAGDQTSGESACPSGRSTFSGRPSPFVERGASCSLASTAPECPRHLPTIYEDCVQLLKWEMINGKANICFLLNVLSRSVSESKPIGEIGTAMGGEVL